MLSFYPTSIITHGMALNITVQTYENSLDLGLMACAQAMPDVRELAAHLTAAFAEFAALPALAAAPAAKDAAESKRASRAAASKAVPASG